MMALMSPKLWAALILAAVMAFAGVFLYRAGAASVRTQWDAATIQQQALAAAQEDDNRKLESKRQTNVIEAQNAQTKRNQGLQVAAAGARTESDGLRDDLAAIRASLPSTTGDASSNAASAAAGLLAECGAAYQVLAGKADGHYSDALTLRQAWPH